MMGIAGLGKIGKGKNAVYKLYIIVDVVGRYVPKGTGGQRKE